MTSTTSRARRAGIAAFVGTTIEWYDFYVYATAAALVFGPLFFPSEDPLAETAAAFATFAVAFLVRPIGGILFGHIGDKLGRRVSLVITLMLMGVATVLVGLLPTYSDIGIAAPILLIALRALQGLAVGGEWGGAVLMSVEHAPEKSKTFYGGFTQLGNPAGALLASGIFAIMTRFGDDFIIDGGWRIPFLLSIVLVGVGLWVRYRVEESPVFEEKVQGRKQSMPLAFALRSNWKPILLGIGILLVQYRKGLERLHGATPSGISFGLALGGSVMLIWPLLNAAYLQTMALLTGSGSASAYTIVAPLVALGFGVWTLLLVFFHLRSYPSQIEYAAKIGGFVVAAVGVFRYEEITNYLARTLGIGGGLVAIIVFAVAVGALIVSVVLGVDPTDILEDEDVEEAVKSVVETAGGD